MHLWRSSRLECIRAIFVRPWTENARTKQEQQTTEIEQFDRFCRTDTNAGGFWSERSGEKTSYPESFLEINRYLALTSYCYTIGQSNNAFSIAGSSLAGKTKRPCFDLFNHWLIKQITDTYRNIFQGRYENRCILNINVALLLHQSIIVTGLGLCSMKFSFMAVPV